MKGIKRKWEWIHDILPTTTKKKNLLKKAQSLAMQIDNILVHTYPHAPTTRYWEDAYPDQDLVYYLSDILQISSRPIFCSACEINLELDAGCEYCRYGKIAGECEDDDNSLFQQFRNLLWKEVHG